MFILNEDGNEEKYVLNQLKDKIQIEVFISRKLKVFFTHILDDVEAHTKSLKIKYVNFESEKYKAEIDKLLKESYKMGKDTAIDLFEKDKIVRELLSKEEIESITKNSEDLIRAYIDKRSKAIGKEILETTKDNFKESWDFVNKMTEDVDVTDEEKQSMMMENFTDRVMNRVDTISSTETQNIYQEMKQNEALGIAQKIQSIGEALQKRWNAILDQNTRPAHAAAHGERVPVDQLYTVDGEMLEYPGDTSNGASLGNVINCRCESVLILL